MKATFLKKPWRFDDVYCTVSLIEENVFSIELVLGFDILGYIILHWIFYCLATLVLLVCLSRISYDSVSMFSVTTLFDQSALYAIVAIASMAGLPPFIGFWTKTAILLAASVQASGFVCVLCWVISVCSLFFYLNTARFVVSLRKLNELDDNSIATEKLSVYTLFVAMLLIVGFAFFGDCLLICALIIG